MWLCAMVMSNACSVELVRGDWIWPSRIHFMSSGAKTVIGLCSEKEGSESHRFTTRRARQSTPQLTLQRENVVRS